MNIIANLFNTILNYTFNITGDWGLAIVLITILVKTILLPLSLKQRTNMRKQLVLSKEMQRIKEKYKDKPKKLEEELQKCYSKNMKGILGFGVAFLQLPIISALYMAIRTMPAEAVTMLVPWIMSIKLPDNNFIIPMIYTLVSLAPSLLSYFKIFKPLENTKVSKKSLIPMAVFSLIITIKAPIALGIYFITSSLFALVEEISFRLYMRKKVLA